jgi:hypothetical protein
MLRPLLAALACALVPLPAVAVDIDERRAAARHFLERAAEHDGVMQLAYASADQMVRVVAGELPDLSGGTMLTIRALLTEEMLGVIAEVMDERREVLAELLTLDELEALNAFQATDAGRSVLRKLPAFNAEQETAIRNAMQLRMPGVVERMISRFE